MKRLLFALALVASVASTAIGQNKYEDAHTHEIVEIGGGMCILEIDGIQTGAPFACPAPGSIVTFEDADPTDGLCDVCIETPDGVKTCKTFATGFTILTPDGDGGFTADYPDGTSEDFPEPQPAIVPQGDGMCVLELDGTPTGAPFNCPEPGSDVKFTDADPDDGLCDVCVTTAAGVETCKTFATGFTGVKCVTGIDGIKTCEATEPDGDVSTWEIDPNTGATSVYNCAQNAATCSWDCTHDADGPLGPIAPVAYSFADDQGLTNITNDPTNLVAINAVADCGYEFELTAAECKIIGGDENGIIRNDLSLFQIYANDQDTGDYGEVIFVDYDGKPNVTNISVSVGTADPDADILNSNAGDNQNGVGQEGDAVDGEYLWHIAESVWIEDGVTTNQVFHSFTNIGDNFTNADRDAAGIAHADNDFVEIWSNFPDTFTGWVTYTVNGKLRNGGNNFPGHSEQFREMGTFEIKFTVLLLSGVVDQSDWVSSSMGASKSAPDFVHFGFRNGRFVTYFQFIDDNEAVHWFDATVQDVMAFLGDDENGAGATESELSTEYFGVGDRVEWLKDWEAAHLTAIPPDATINTVKSPKNAFADVHIKRDLTVAGNVLVDGSLGSIGPKTRVKPRYDAEGNIVGYDLIFAVESNEHLWLQPFRSSLFSGSSVLYDLDRMQAKPEGYTCEDYDKFSASFEFVKESGFTAPTVSYKASVICVEGRSLLRVDLEEGEFEGTISGNLWARQNDVALRRLLELDEKGDHKNYLTAPKIETNEETQ